MPQHGTSSQVRCTGGRSECLGRGKLGSPSALCKNYMAISLMLGCEIWWEIDVYTYIQYIYIYYTYTYHFMGFPGFMIYMIWRVNATTHSPR